MAKTAKKIAKKPARSSRSGSKAEASDQGFASARDALAELMESQLVTEVIAAGAAAGLAAMTQHALSKKEGGAKTALQEGAKAAAAAAGARLAEEIEEIVKSAREASGEPE